jgi:translation initiation factor 1
MNTKTDTSRLVYSTEHGTMCPACSKPQRRCSCGRRQPVVNNDGIVRVGRSTKGRKGKGVTVVIGVPGNNDALKVLSKELKKKVGTGGTVKDGLIEIQGDHRKIVAEELRKKGYTVKLSGG